MSQLRAITVFCSSSTQVDPVYINAATQLGAAIAQQNWTLIYGGNRIGMMGALADAARAQNGKVIGITPQLLIDKGIGDERCDELIVTQNMRERKALMEQRGDAFIALPGGLGTFEELFEIIVARLLGYHTKPIVIVNIENYYAPLLAMIDHGINQNFIREKSRTLFHLTTTIPQTIAILQNTTEPPPLTTQPANSID